MVAIERQEKVVWYLYDFFLVQLNTYLSVWQSFKKISCNLDVPNTLWNINIGRHGVAHRDCLPSKCWWLCDCVCVSHNELQSYAGCIKASHPSVSLPKIKQLLNRGKNKSHTHLRHVRDVFYADRFGVAEFPQGGSCAPVPPCGQSPSLCNPFQNISKVCQA